MNKLLAFALFALIALAGLCFNGALAEKDEPLESELEEDFELGTDGGANGQKGLRDIWGRHDVIQDGIGDYTEGRKHECQKRKGAEDCKTCCANLGKSYEYAPLKREGFRLGKCTCFAKARAV